LAEEFVIKSQQIEDKINQLLPSQGGFQAGVDFSASTMVIPIVDLTETAEGSSLRQDLQTSISHNTATVFNINATTTTILTTTGYFSVVGSISGVTSTGGTEVAKLFLNDGATDKQIYGASFKLTNPVTTFLDDFNLVIKLDAGDSFKIEASNDVNVIGYARQIADLSGNLQNP